MSDCLAVELQLSVQNNIIQLRDKYMQREIVRLYSGWITVTAADDRVISVYIYYD